MCAAQLWSPWPWGSDCLILVALFPGLGVPRPETLGPLCHHLQVQSWPSLWDWSWPQIGETPLALIQRQARAPCKEPPRSQPLNQTVSKWAVCLMYTNVPDRSQHGSILPTERLKLRKASLLLLRSCTQGMLEPPCERWERLSFKPCLTLPLGPVCLLSEELPNTTDFFQNACLCC